MKTIILAALVLGLSACASKDAEPQSATQATLAKMSAVTTKCESVGSEVHAFNAPVNSTSAVKYLCGKSLTFGGCSAWISAQSFNSTYQPVPQDLDSTCP